MRKGSTPKRKSPDWQNQTLDDEDELMPPNQQLQEHSMEQDDDHIGGKVKALALELSMLADEKLSKRVRIELLENVAMAACRCVFDR